MFHVADLGVLENLGCRWDVGHDNFLLLYSDNDIYSILVRRCKNKKLESKNISASLQVYLFSSPTFLHGPTFFVSLLLTPNFADQLLLFRNCDSDFQDDDVTTFRRCSAKVQAFDRLLLLRVKITKLA